ncbi:flagellar hook-associated protein FlgL [Jannaschia seosinensis]|uniref:Flagellar hook-associated protein FlgL n=1 Tax=Jannaschia seosinensis TaxID=313367 RepID=A0A0M7B863_9RHOB|nr:hypothetical protein [Jannaschia seosinensis]CUH35257.1 flagellar hook-associated protein FlgL [Jannaschia seosinensis]
MTTNIIPPFVGPKDHSVETRTRIATLTAEMSSGRKADLGRAVASDFSEFSRIAHDVRTNEARRHALAAASSYTATAQTALEAVGKVSEKLTSQVLTSASVGGFSDPRLVADMGRNALTDIVSALSTRSGDRAIFANGDVSDTPPINLTALLTETAAIAAGAANATDMLDAFDLYFAPGGGIETTALSAFPASEVVFPTGDGNAIGMPTSLSDPGLREVLKQAALAASLDDVGFAMDQSASSVLGQRLSTQAIGAADGLVSVQARIGGVEERMARVASGIADEGVRLQMRHNDLVTADPFETATRLENEMTRLETIFAITARRSGLRLTNFLR